MPPPVASPARRPAADPAVRARILAAAHAHFFAYGYSALILDDLARELGMSKKTLYIHFASKDVLVEEIFNEFSASLRAEADTIFADASLGFPAKMHRFGEAMLQRLTRLSPHFLRDLQRCAPQLYRKLEELRNQNIPLIFGRIVRQGQAAGIVRTGVDPAFAVEFWRSAIQSLLHPDNLERFRLAPSQVMLRAIDLFFGGLLTPAGRKDHEKHIAP
jgi:AcrR family transcriptional regulator